MRILARLTFGLIFLPISTLNAQYCASNATISSGTKINNVSLNGDTQDINNNSTGSCQMYTDYTAIAPADLTVGSNYTISSTEGSCSIIHFTSYKNAWIDWNQDGDFADANEMIGTGTAGSNTANLVTNMNFTVPAFAVLGTTRMRVVVTETSFAGTNPCTTYYYGETEDYNVTIVSAGSMAYVSTTAIQASTSTVGNCLTSPEIIGVQVVTTGSSAPLSITQFNIGTAGTTNLGELSGISIYYTGNTSSYSPTNLFATVAPGGAVVLNGSQVLSGGTNYFWVVYNLITPTTITNTLDGTCTSIVVNSVSQVPSVASPPGIRTIGACHPFPGGVPTGLQIWLKADQGTTGNNPVTAWQNQGPNATITQVTSTVGTVMQSGENHNFNSGIRLAGGANYLNGVFSATSPDRTSVLSGNGVTMFTVYSDGGYDLSMSFHASSNATNQWQAFAFRHGGLGALYSGSGGGLLYNTPTNRSTNILGFRGTSSGSGQNTFNGMYTTGNVPSFTAYNGAYQYCVGLWPGYANNNITSENIVFDSDMSAIDFHKVESYLAIKYGVTLGVNGVSIDYNSSSNFAVWTQSANSGFAFDIAGVMRDDYSGLYQLKSHSVNGSSFGLFNDIVTVVNGSVFSSPTSFSSDKSSLIWGHNGGVLNNTNVVVNYPTDNSEVIQAIFSREWKSQETGTVNDVVLEFDVSLVVGSGGTIGTNDLANLRLLVDEDGDYSVGATSYAPISYNNVTGIAYFRHDFTPTTGNNMDQNNGFFFTIGTTDMLTTPLPVELISFEVSNEECSNKIEWSTASELNCDYFVIEKSYDMNDWTSVGTITGAGNSNQTLDYLYRDNDFDQNGMIYYRIVQVDTDGKETVISMKTVNAYCDQNYEPIAYPNPVTNQLNVESTLAGDITITDLNGRIVRKSTIVQGTTMIDISGMIQGSYIVTIELSSGKSFISRLVKI